MNDLSSLMKEAVELAPTQARPSFIKKVGGNLSVPALISLGSSLKICLVAKGKADVYPRLGPTSEWDTAAAQCVLEQSRAKPHHWGQYLD